LPLFQQVMTRKLLAVFFSVGMFACEDVQSTSSQPPLRVYRETFLSKPFVVDQIYRSMKGPKKFQRIRIGGEGAPERILLISYQTEIVDPATGEVVSEEFMCHNNLNFVDLDDHQKALGTKNIGLVSERLFTLSQGAMNVEFPKGFGVPMMSDETLRLATQILNLNPVDQTREIQYRTTVRYVRNEDAKGRIRPLFQRGVQGLKLLSGTDGYYGAEAGDTEGHGESCSIGELAGKRTFADHQGRKFAAHWIVEPGLEENHTFATAMLGLHEDTTAHYIAVHLHPFAESLELRDLTTGETVFKSKATNSVDRIGLDHVEFFSSKEGIQLYKDHDYTLISIYDNTTEEQQDAMAVMFVYMLDKNFEAKIKSTDSRIAG
jgi:hypothetical protein